MCWTTAPFLTPSGGTHRTLARQNSPSRDGPPGSTWPYPSRRRQRHGDLHNGSWAQVQRIDSANLAPASDTDVDCFKHGLSLFYIKRPKLLASNEYPHFVHRIWVEEAHWSTLHA